MLFAAMVDYRAYGVDAATNAAAPVSNNQNKDMHNDITNDKRTRGLLLTALMLMLIAWLGNLRTHLTEWASEANDSPAVKQPNILLIVADDLGYNDSTIINAGGIATPNLKALAADGVTFTRHYADATCTPSRVALLTGRYAERSGFRPIGIEIPAEFPTIAQQLEVAGYATYLTGKWHAGEERSTSGPQYKGFQSWFGFLNQWELSGEITQANKGKGRRPTYNNPMLRTNGGPLVPHDGHLTDILTQHTVDKIRSLETSGQPWFIYHAFLAPHHPIQPAQRYREQFPDTPEGEYRALVTQMDDAIGKLLEAVDRENTLVVFLSDNGGTNKQLDNNFPFHGKKGDALEGAYRTPLVLSWPQKIPAGKIVDETVMNVDLFPTLLAAAGGPSAAGIDGENLWPVIVANTPPVSRGRSWEVYSENVGTMNFSYLSQSGRWRLASEQGVALSLYDLAAEPAGKTDVASIHPLEAGRLADAFWAEHWRKSLLADLEKETDPGGTTYYRGLDAMRTPYRYGLTIGLEIGPLPADVLEASNTEGITLAGQSGIWELHYQPTSGLEWRIGNRVLRDAGFDPYTCNPVVLSNYFQPMAHLAVREPQSMVKLYRSGLLADYDNQFDYSTVTSSNIEAPTFVHFNGQAQFANLTVSSFYDPYEPRIRDEFKDIYTDLHKAGKLSIVDVAWMTRELCQEGPQ